MYFDRMATTIERLKAEIREEKRIKQDLEESTAELSATIHELKEGLSKIETGANEWQLRYETQLEKNQQLASQAKQLEEDIKNAKESKTSQVVAQQDLYQDMSDTNLKLLLKQLVTEKQELEHQLTDYEWRLDRESRAFHKADEDRRIQMSEIAHAQLLLSEGQGKKRQSLNKKQKDQEEKLSKQLAETASITGKQNSPKSSTAEGLITTSAGSHEEKGSSTEGSVSPQPQSTEQNSTATDTTQSHQ